MNAVTVNSSIRVVRTIRMSARTKEVIETKQDVLDAVRHIDAGNRQQALSRRDIDPGLRRPYKRRRVRAVEHLYPNQNVRDCRLKAGKLDALPRQSSAVLTDKSAFDDELASSCRVGGAKCRIFSGSRSTTGSGIPESTGVRHSNR